MSEVTSTAPESSQPETEQETSSNRFKELMLGTTMAQFLARMTMIPVLIFLGIFLVGFLMAWFYPEGSAGRFSYIRSLFEIIVSITIIIIFIAFGVLIVQIARFVNLLRSEVKPITQDTKQAIKSVRVTAEFVQKNAVKPVIEANSFIAGLLAFLREISQIIKILQRRNEADEVSQDEQETEQSST